jgi:DNA-cytosine methyltransferase
MKVLSCFDGMSCGQIAFERAGIPIEKYYASEIDKYAIKVTQSNYPDTVQLGSITEWQSWDIEKPDIIIGGSPCQGFSFAGKGLNFEDDRSKLFFVFVDILKHYKPKYFLLENVVMKKEHNDVISGILGEIYPECVQQTELFRTGRLEPIQINSALVSAQNRQRLYWTNIPGIEQPEDKGILLKDIIENATADKDKSYCLDANYYKGASKEQSDLKGRRQLVLKDLGNRIIGVQNDKKHSTASEHVYHKENDKGSLVFAHVPKIITGGAFRGRNKENPSDRTPGIDTEQRLEINETGKSNALTSVSKDSLVIGFENNKSSKIQDRIKSNICDLYGKGNCMLATLYKGAANNGATVISTDNITWRKLTPVECERLQTVPDNYTNHVSNSQRYKMLGNGWTIDVIAHIFKNIEY